MWQGDSPRHDFRAFDDLAFYGRDLLAHTVVQQLALFYKVMIPRPPSTPPPAKLLNVGVSSDNQDAEHAHDAEVMTPTQPTTPPPASLYKVGDSCGSKDKEPAHEAVEVLEPVADDEGVWEEWIEDQLAGEWEDWPTDKSWCWEDWSDDNKKDAVWSSWHGKKEEENQHDHGWWQHAKNEDGNDWWQQKKQDYDDAPSDGICRQPAPWAANKGHVANNDRDQRVPGEAWITADGEKVWTHAETGVTYASH